MLIIKNVLRYDNDKYDKSQGRTQQIVILNKGQQKHEYQIEILITKATNVLIIKIPKSITKTT